MQIPVSMQCVHRDIKLENLLLDSKDAVQVRPYAINPTAYCCMKWLAHALPTFQGGGSATHLARQSGR